MQSSFLPLHAAHLLRHLNASGPRLPHPNSQSIALTGDDMSSGDAAGDTTTGIDEEGNSGNTKVVSSIGKVNFKVEGLL
ncbi:hypothetical protein CCR75_005295 [Bremia lactucae]|uniref:Uncharacterized protein n=1 Tax=Bremia lactucae TaxID=4779 RepID=A0A976FQH9_BRELC|nr:hypothetical protein CCR75_005295 [Bremia lactucae]